VLAALKFAAAKETRDWVQIYVLSFLPPARSSALTVEPDLRAGLPRLLGGRALRARALRCSPRSRRGGRQSPAREETFVEPSLFRSLALDDRRALRVDARRLRGSSRAWGPLLRRNRSAAAVSSPGFSEEVGLGSVAALKQDDAVALRVTVDRPDLFHRAVYWRGAALDHFDGPVTGGESHRRFGRSFGALPVSSRRRPPCGVDRRQRGDDSRANRTLRRFSSPDGPIEVRGRFAGWRRDALGNLRVLRPTGVRTPLSNLCVAGSAPNAADAETLDIAGRRPANRRARSQRVTQGDRRFLRAPEALPPAT